MEYLINGVAAIFVGFLLPITICFVMHLVFVGYDSTKSLLQESRETLSKGLRYDRIVLLAVIFFTMGALAGLQIFALIVFLITVAMALLLTIFD